MPPAAPQPPDAQALGRFLAESPPRVLPPEVRRARLPRGPLVAALLIAGALLAASVPLVSRVFPERLLADLQIDFADPRIGPGEVLGITPSGLRSGGGPDQTSASIDRLAFRFTAIDGVVHDGVCHAARHGRSIGERVQIEYLGERPQQARIVGTTLSRTPAIGAAVLLFPLLAIVWLTATVSRRRRAARLLCRGEFTAARVVRLESVRASTTPVRRDTAVLRLLGGREDGLELELHPRGREVALLERRHTAGQSVHLLIDPRRPGGRPLVVDTLLMAPGANPADRATADDDDDDDAEDDDMPSGWPPSSAGSGAR